MSEEDKVEIPEGMGPEDSEEPEEPEEGDDELEDDMVAARCPICEDLSVVPKDETGNIIICLTCKKEWAEDELEEYREALGNYHERVVKSQHMTLKEAKRYLAKNGWRLATAIGEVLETDSAKTVKEIIGGLFR